MSGAWQLDRVGAALEEALDGAVDGPVLLRTGVRPMALGWATVELDRAAASLAGELSLPPEAFENAAETIALGARCRLARGVLTGGASLVLLEPATEGRLAASLARLGEGPAAIWLSVPGLAATVAALRAVGVATSAECSGPFGPERLILGGPVHGPHRLLIRLPAVPSAHDRRSADLASTSPTGRCGSDRCPVHR